MVTVIWLDEADSALATAFMAAREHGLAADFTRAIHRAERDIQAAPRKTGESRRGRRRFHVVRPAAVLYEFHEPEGVVVVLTVHFTTPRQKG
jgi:hypothetical protein